MKIAKIALIFAALAVGSRCEGAFIVEADNVAPGGKAFDHFVSTPPGTGFQLSATPSTAVGLSGDQSAFGNPANATGPDRYELFYTPGIDLDNTIFAPGTSLGNSRASDLDGAGPGLPSYTIAPRFASGVTGGASGFYNVYFTTPASLNVNAAGSTITVNNAGSPVVLNPVNLNSGGTGPDEVAGGTYTGGANSRWLLLGTVPLSAGTTYSVVVEANANPPDAVSQRTHGVMWEYVGALPLPGPRALYGVQPVTGSIVRVDPLTGFTAPFAFPAGLNAGDTRIGLSGAEGGGALIYENDDDGSISDINRFDPLTGALLSTHSNEGWETDGLSYQAGSIFYSHTVSDVHRQAGYDGPESYFASQSPSVPIGGLAGDDMGRAFENDLDGLIREFDPITGSILNAFAAPASNIEGLAFDGTVLYASTSAGMLYTLNASTGAVLNAVNVSGGALYGLGVALTVPEPATLHFLVIALLGCRLSGRRRKQ